MGTFLLWILGAIIVGGIGAERDCGFVRGFLISIVLSPIIGGIMVLCCRKKKSLTEMLTEAKLLYDAKTISEEGYNKMVYDITHHGKAKNIRNYR